jgi:tetratricopeptide (TPR) repeat protein
MNHKTLRFRAADPDRESLTALSLSLTLTQTILLFGLLTPLIAVAGQPSQLIESNPLLSTEPDPLLPNPPKNGQLVSPEREILAQALDQLNLEATAQLAAGNTPVAFAIWNRELRLRRYLGPMDELAALSRVGAIAWEQEDSTQLRIITRRLENLEVDYCSPSKNSCGLEFLTALVKGYESVKARDLAIKVYQTMLADAQNRQDIETTKTLWSAIARLSLEKLDYTGAAMAYEQLLAIAETQGNQPEVINYVEQLSYIYSQGKQYSQAIAMRQRLVQFYLNTQDLRLIPELKLAIGQDYQILNQLNLAINNYQESYTLAWTLQQFAVAREALIKIANIYQQAAELEKAIQVYEALVIVDQRATNFYGLMTTYWQLGKLYKMRENYPQAIAAFQRGLEISQQFQFTDYQSDFIQNIEELKR